MSNVGNIRPDFLMPVGTVLPYAGASAPSGYLLCDGAEYVQATYADLYAVLTTTYNTQVNPTTGSAWAAPAGGSFRVPDYRGTFMRGIGTPYQGDAATLGGFQKGKTAVQPLGSGGLSAGTSSVSGTYSGSASGSVSGPTLGESSQHSHSLTWHEVTAISLAAGSQGYVVPGSTTSTSVDNSNHTHTFSASLSGGSSSGTISGTAAAQSISGDNETRPHNKGVNYIIKY